MSKPIDLKQYILMIADKKDIDATFSLDQGCVVETDDPSSLIKVLNYIFNLITEKAGGSLEVSLEFRDKHYLLTFIVIGGNADVIELPGGINDALKSYNADANVKVESGTGYITLTFNR